MATVLKEKAKENYSRAVSHGHYDLYQGGLAGKHDNVRCYWEDRIRGSMLRPHLEALADRKKKTQSKVSVADLGSGTGEGLRLLTTSTREEENLELSQTRILPMSMIGRYVGCDICEAMVEQGNANFIEWPDVVFRLGDFSRGFPLKDEPPFDIYFSSYGSLSHIDDAAMERLLVEIVEHTEERALFVGDWLGRHSIEWPCYWGEPGGKMQDYSMCWLHREEPECAEHFPMRYWTGEEIRALVERVEARTGASVKVRELFDCSLFVGRHVDTRAYNEWVRPVRAAVNRLHEQNIRTNLENVKVQLRLVPGFDDLNACFAKLEFCWNRLVEYCQKRMQKRLNPVRLNKWRTFPSALQIAILTLDRVIDTVSWMRMGDPRANIIEPQLGYALRNLEMEFQKGLGRGHALVGIFEIRKPIGAEERRSYKA